MLRYAMFILLAVIGSMHWVYSNASLLTWQAERWLSIIVFDPGHASPVVIGGAFMVLCVAVLFRHVTAWLLAYIAFLSVPVGAFAAAMALITPANLAIRSGGEILRHDDTSAPSAPVAPRPHESQPHRSADGIALPR